jgi:hypothetical protein
MMTGPRRIVCRWFSSVDRGPVPPTGVGLLRGQQPGKFRTGADLEFLRSELGEGSRQPGLAGGRSGTCSPANGSSASVCTPAVRSSVMPSALAAA